MTAHIRLEVQLKTNFEEFIYYRWKEIMYTFPYITILGASNGLNYQGEGMEVVKEAETPVDLGRTSQCLKWMDSMRLWMYSKTKW